jgi:hypothetical protein
MNSKRDFSDRELWILTVLSRRFLRSNDIKICQDFYKKARILHFLSLKYRLYLNRDENIHYYCYKYYFADNVYIVNKGFKKKYVYLNSPYNVYVDAIVEEESFNNVNSIIIWRFAYFLVYVYRNMFSVVFNFNWEGTGSDLVEIGDVEMIENMHYQFTS